MPETRYEKILREKLILTQDMVLQGMTEGPGYGDFSEYKYNLGYLAALKRALEAMEETRSDLEKE